MDITFQPEELIMREQPTPVRAWIRGDLSARFGLVLSEAIPQSMLELLPAPSRQD